MTISAGAGGNGGIGCPSDLKPLSGGYEAPQDLPGVRTRLAV